MASGTEPIASQRTRPRTRPIGAPRRAAPSRPATVDVRPVAGRRDLRAFIRLPWRLYRDAPNWVPPLLSERKRHLDPRANPFFEHAEAQYFIAWREDEAVGRISAHIDHRFNDFQHNRWGMFGFFECVDDRSVASALLASAANWLRERGRDRMIGPLDFSTNHECGLLVEGHDLAPQILENWHHPYYAGLIEAAGFTRAMDLLKWEIRYEHRPEVLPVIAELAARLEPEHGIRLRRMLKRNLRSEVRAFMDVYNEAWSSNWGFVPLTDHELDHMARELAPVLDEDFACVAETRGGEVVGVSLSLPDFNRVLARLNGRLLPFGWVRALREKSRIREIRVFALGVRPAYQHLGVAAGLYQDVWEACARRGIRRAETGWILETNRAMNAAMEALTGRVVKRYRIYERPVSGA